ncbi:L-type lectin-domain containing receptor kinase IX.1-like [Panicum miliaceum]|uniref:non-specific serine/threonine protein kinase n=1 Tax=Panicum miliaceum TaxID=4540 RepID=A0A3L6SMP0_PANMI|nr:L-type lectin-domain containing receptor kinase IX.1-like [Panicum miliaceum]
MGISGGGAGAGAVALPVLLLLLLLPPPAAPFSFTYNFTSPSDTPPPGIAFQGDAFYSKAIRLTRDERLGPITSSAGRAFYSRAVPLADPVTRRPASFAAAFAFSIAAPNRAAASGDRLAFFLSPFPSALPGSSAGGLLGLFNSSAPRAGRLVAVEFDTYKNKWDPSGDHVGVDIGGIVSAATADWPTSMKDGCTAHARVAYDGGARNLTVALSYGAARPNATGDVLLWDHLLVLVGAGVVWFVKQWRKTEEFDDGDIVVDDVMGGEYDELANEFVVESGPRRFRYAELAAATRNFAEDRKLGQGGFGAVYRGFLKELGLEVTIKRVSKGSTQGRKEYAAEVRIINQLRHRHLVRLVGWCHEHRGDFLLVYELMPNGSVDHHLYGKGVLLTWPTRYDVALGLASAMLSLHEECAQCIVHRDIKPSNVMLDATFSAKLGDFGLAKLVEHGSQPYTTALAGTLGYLAPECVMTGKASRESDVYSFGVVALEIACGRRPAELNEEPSKARLVPWVWELYGKNALLEAVDWRLKVQFDEEQMERLMVVGLWCAHPDYAHRPSIRQALNVLKFEAPLPVLPPKMPVPTYFPLPDLVAPISVGGASSTEDPGVSDCGSSGQGSSVRDRLLEP